MPVLPNDYHHHSNAGSRRTQANVYQLRQANGTCLRSTTSPVQGERLGKGLGSFQSPAGCVGYSLPTHSARLIRSKRNKFTRQGEQFAKPRRDSTQGSINGKPKRCGKQLFFVTFAEKEEKKMTLLKQTMYRLPSTGTKPSFYPPTEAAIDAGVTDPSPDSAVACTRLLWPHTPRRVIPGRAVFWQRSRGHTDRKSVV